MNRQRNQESTLDGDNNGTTEAERAARFLHQVTSALARGEVRESQLKMCTAVANAIASKRHLVVQAGTGTGKSLAYIVPAVLSKKRVVVATATKGLQDQLAEKDLPLVAKALKRSTRFTFAVLKGRSNYLCLQRSAESRETGYQQSLEDESLDDSTDENADLHATAFGEHVQTLLEWGKKTTTGDRGELSFEPHPRAWSMLSVGPNECPGKYQCPSGEQCFAEKARERAGEADVVIVNTHLYGAHLAVLEASGHDLLPPHEVVIFDEAHELEEVMTSSLGVDLSPGRFRALARAARGVLQGDDASGVIDAITDVGEQLRHLLVANIGTRLLSDHDGAVSDGAVSTDSTLINILELGSARVDAIRPLLDVDDSDGRVDDSPEAVARRNRTLTAADHLLGDLARVLSKKHDEVAWVDGDAKSPTLRLSPIDIAAHLAESLWGDVTSILTSATIPANVVAKVGLLTFDVDELDVGSPFDYANHSLLYVATHLPDRKLQTSNPAIVDELELLINAARGRTLALFTSHRAVNVAAQALRSRLGYRLMTQGELPKAKLLSEFAKDESSCLFATLGFWQGVDVPGPSLTLVTLDRLPFPRPDDPLFQARREFADSNGLNAFRAVDIPRAATLLAQGVGRLIRTGGDTGVVAVLDPRLAKASYRGLLLAGLPPMRRTTQQRQAIDFLKRCTSASTQ